MGGEEKTTDADKDFMIYPAADGSGAACHPFGGASSGRADARSERGKKPTASSPSNLPVNLDKEKTQNQWRVKFSGLVSRRIVRDAAGPRAGCDARFQPGRREYIRRQEDAGDRAAQIAGHASMRYCRNLKLNIKDERRVIPSPCPAKDSA